MRLAEPIVLDSVARASYRRYKTSDSAQGAQKLIKHLDSGCEWELRGRWLAVAFGDSSLTASVSITGTPFRSEADQSIARRSTVLGRRVHYH